MFHEPHEVLDSPHLVIYVCIYIYIYICISSQLSCPPPRRVGRKLALSFLAPPPTKGRVVWSLLSAPALFLATEAEAGLPCTSKLMPGLAMRILPLNRFLMNSYSFSMKWAPRSGDVTATDFVWLPHHRGGGGEDSVLHSYHPRIDSELVGPYPSWGGSQKFPWC